MDCKKCDGKMHMQSTGDADIVAVPQCLYCGYEDYENARVRSAERRSSMLPIYARYRGKIEKSKNIVVEMRAGKYLEPICPFCEDRVKMELVPYPQSTGGKMGKDGIRYHCEDGHRIWVFENDTTWS